MTAVSREESKIDKVSFDVNAVFCISLAERADRRELFQASIQRLIGNPVSFHLAERNKDPVRGCYESHQAIARFALENKLDRVLIFEDDVAPYALKESQIRWVNKFLRARKFEVLHLGYSMGRIWLTWFPFIARGRVVALHAYVLSRKGCQTLVDTPYDGTPVDVVFKKQIKQHCVFPMLFRQHPAEATGSDIETSVKNEDEWWQVNWNAHIKSASKNMWRTVFRVGF